jgi:hypothetical protein
MIVRIEESDELLGMVAASFLPEERKNLMVLLEDMFAVGAREYPTISSPTAENLWSDFCDRIHVKKDFFPKTRAILKDRGRAFIEYRVQKQQLTRSMGLDWSADRRDQFLSSLPNLQLPKLKKPWPPKNVWLSESTDTAHLWRSHFQHGRLHDKRTKRKPVIVSTKDSSWVKIIRADESAIVRDAASGKIILIVIRNFCGNQEVLDWVNDIVQATLDIKKSVRLDDPGKIVLNGYSSGSRSAPQAMWAKNLLQSPTRLFETQEQLQRFDFQVSSTYALMWNMCRRKLPPVMLEDIDKLVNSNGCRAVMDGNGTMQGYYGMELKQNYFEFHSAELAPPQGNFAQNYSRFCHYEKNAHEYCLAWTTSRLQHPSCGGNFYLAKYGIKVEASSDNIVVWRGRDLHGTTLPDVDPARLETDFKQIGLSFTTGGRLLEVLRQVKKGEVPKEELFQRVAELEEDDYEEDRI